MAKVSNPDIYKYNLTPRLLDYLLGTDSFNNKKTTSYKIQDIIKLMNSVNGISNLQFTFSDGSDPEINVYHPGIFFTDNNETDPLLFTQLVVNKESMQPIDLTLLFQKLATLPGLILKLVNPEDPNNFFKFDIVAIEDHIEYFTITVSILNDLYFGELVNKDIYGIVFDVKDTVVKTSDIQNDGADGTHPFITAEDIPTITGFATEEYVNQVDTILDNRIVILESLQDLSTNFTSQAYVVWTGVGYIYDVIYPDYYIQGILYPGATEQITLDPSDATYSRFDVISVNSLGAKKTTGIAALNPLVPTIDAENEIFITSELVTAASIIPIDNTIEQVYNENTEWTTSSNNGNAVNFNATGTPYKGVKHADIGNHVAGQNLKYTSPETLSITNFTTLKFALNLKVAFGKSKVFQIHFYNGPTAVSDSYSIGSGRSGFRFNIVEQYQLIVVDFTSFAFSGTSFDNIVITFPSANPYGFRVDDVVLVKGSTSISPKQKTITSIITDSGIANATIPDDTFTLKGGNGATVSAVGKVITVTPANQTKSQVGLSNVDNTGDANKPVSIAQQSALDLKVDKITGKGLSTEDYTASEKNKLASIDATHYLPPLQTTVQLSALPQAGISDKARVYVETDLSDYFYDTTASSGDIAPNDQTGGIGFWRKVAVGGETAASIKTKYESNANTNAFTDVLKAKLDSITAIFTTGLKTIYDGVVSDLSTLLSTGSRLITTGEITKLANTSNTNTGDQDLSNFTKKQYNSVVHLGNSITIHPITSFWWGEWGMAATVRENDYVHKFWDLLKIKNPNADSIAFHISEWEIDYSTFDKTTMDSYLLGRDLIVLRLGENVTYYADFQNQYKILVQYIQSKAPNATIVLGGQFWVSATKETAMQNVANELKLPFVSIKHLDSATYKQTMGSMVYGDDLAWHAIDYSGVAIHPNDLGMLKIAESLFSALSFPDEIDSTTPQKEIIGNVTLDDSFNGCIVKVKAIATITVPANLKPSFNCVFDIWPDFAGTFVAGSGATISSDGLKLLSGKMATLYKDGSNPVYRLKGETSV